LRLPARAGGPEGFELGEQAFGVLDDRGDLAGMGRTRSDAPEAAPRLLQAADDAVQEGGIDHDRASVECGPAARRSDRARSGTIIVSANGPIDLGHPAGEGAQGRIPGAEGLREGPVWADGRLPSDEEPRR